MIGPVHLAVSWRLTKLLDARTAQEITGIFTEVVIAPDATAEAKEIFAAKKNLRLLTTGALADSATAAQVIRQVSGGFLLQDKDNGLRLQEDLSVVTKRAPSEQEMADLLFAWKVAKHVKSNAIVYVKEGRNGWRGCGADEPG